MANPARRPSKLDNPDFAKQVAIAFADGQTRPQMAELFNVSEWTITQWRKHPMVKAYTNKLIEDRVQRVLTKTDYKIAALLENITDIDTLLRVRKEFLGGRLRQQIENHADDATVDSAMDAMEDTEFTDALEEVLRDKINKKPQ